MAVKILTLVLFRLVSNPRQVDLASGDVIRCRDNMSPLVLATTKHARGKGGGYDETCCIRVIVKGKNTTLSFQKSHLVQYALDPHNSLFEIVHRFTVFRGYWDRTKKTFVRPNDNCVDLIEDDGLGGACKTDGEHTLGYGFNSLWGVWKSHHAVNRWMHHIRERAENWLHPYMNEKYAKEQKNRHRLPFQKSLSETLSEQLTKKVAAAAEELDVNE
jgi:hypothetical protein